MTEGAQGKPGIRAVLEETRSVADEHLAVASPEVDAHQVGSADRHLMEVVQRQTGQKLADAVNFTGLMEYSLAMYLPQHQLPAGRLRRVCRGGWGGLVDS